MLPVSHKLDKKRIEKALDLWAEAQGAKVTRQGRLVRKYRTDGDSMHWHLGGVKAGMGTVEVTYWPDVGKLEVLVHENRPGYWAGKAFRDL
ncbi:MAG TPA: hypothetical protein VE177_06315, partial [Candidatus Binatus sp.]|nr:hypothetical protein [Candidatus Binatus sp.]